MEVRRFHYTAIVRREGGDGRLLVRPAIVPLRTPQRVLPCRAFTDLGSFPAPPRSRDSLRRLLQARAQSEAAIAAFLTFAALFTSPIFSIK